MTDKAGNFSPFFLLMAWEKCGKFLDKRMGTAYTTSRKGVLSKRAERRVYSLDLT